MLYVGLDVHSRQSSLCILDASGGTVNRFSVKGPRGAVVDRLRQLDQPFSLCYARRPAATVTCTSRSARWRRTWPWRTPASCG